MRAVFFRDGELLAASLNADRLELTGPPVQAIGNLPASVSAVPVVDLSSSSGRWCTHRAPP